MPSSRVVITVRVLLVALLMIGTPVLAGQVAGGYSTTLATLVGLICYAFLAGGMFDRTRSRTGPADLITLTRGSLGCAAAAYAVLVLRGDVEPQGWTIFAVVITAALLDGVDGVVARKTATATRAGARFDAETDAAFFLILSVIVAALVGPWVIASGMMRYVFGLMTMLLPGWRRALPPRGSRRVVAAIQGTVLAVVLAPVIPTWLATAACAVALALLTWSFGRDIAWLQRQTR